MKRFVILAVLISKKILLFFFHNNVLAFVFVHTAFILIPVLSLFICSISCGAFKIGVYNLSNEVGFVSSHTLTCIRII